MKRLIMGMLILAMVCVGCEGNTEAEGWDEVIKASEIETRLVEDLDDFIKFAIKVTVQNISDSQRDLTISFQALDADGFAMPGTEGAWYGVFITGETVTGISLGGNKLVGALPAELGNLTSLRYLTLSSNELSGSIPPELGNLTNVHRISVHQIGLR